MLNRISSRIARKLVACTGEDKEEIYIYGLELIITTCLGFLSILLLSAILGELRYGVIFLVVYSPLRLFVGGYHADTYGKCFVISNLTYLLVLLMNYVFVEHVSLSVWFVTYGVLTIYIAVKSPVLHKSQPISIYKQERSKKIARILLLVYSLLLVIIAVVDRKMVGMTVLSVCLVAAFMLYANIEKNRMEVSV